MRCNHVKNRVAVGDCVSARIRLVRRAFALSPRATVYLEYFSRKPVDFPSNRNKGKSCEGPKQGHSWLLCRRQSWAASHAVQLRPRGGNSAPPEAGASPAYGSRHGEAQPCPHLRCGMCLAAGTVRVCRDPSSGRLSQGADGHQPAAVNGPSALSPSVTGWSTPCLSRPLGRPPLLAFPVSSFVVNISLRIISLRTCEPSSLQGRKPQTLPHVGLEGMEAWARWVTAALGVTVSLSAQLPERWLWEGPCGRSSWSPGICGAVSSTALPGREMQLWQSREGCWRRRPAGLPDARTEYVENFMDSVLTEMKVQFCFILCYQTSSCVSTVLV